MREHRRLSWSIAGSIVGLLLGQILIFAAIVAIYRIRPTTARGYFLVLLISHLVLLTFLYYRRADFFLVHSGTPLRRMNIPNLLTLTRISSTPTILYLLILSADNDVVPFMIVFTVAVFLTDLFDGRISRQRGEITKIGQYLDSMSDYALLGAVSIGFLYHNLISDWFFAVFAGRFGLQGLGMGLLLLARGSVDPRSTWSGKISVAAVMILLALTLLELIPSVRENARAATAILEYPAAVLLGVSAVEKGLLFSTWVRKAPSERSMQSHGSGPS